MEKTLINKTQSRLNAVQVLAIGFLIVILAGGILLSLPISSADGNSTNFLDAVFTSTSAVCVTGLVTLDTGTHWNTFGQIIILMLIEIGGLGFMSVTTFVAILLGKKITLRDRLIMQEAMNTFGIQGLVKMVKYVVILTVSVQLLGAVVLSSQFIPQFGVAKGIFYGIFHSASAFCNAGFDLLGNFNSVTGYSNNFTVILTLSVLIILGGLGFTVLLELINYKRTRRLSVNSKMVLFMTGILIFCGTIVLFILEYNNAETIGNMNMGQKILNSFFSAISPRTAGMNSVSTDGMTISSKFVTIILMMIGGSSGSTAGGIKTATIGVLVFTVISVLKGREDTEAFGRRFSKETVYKAFTITFIGIIIVVCVTMILTIVQKDSSFINLFYEAASAFGTAGLTTGVTQKLTTIGKIVIMITMYFGRVGPLTVFVAILNRKKKSAYKYAEGKILIG